MCNVSWRKLKSSWLKVKRVMRMNLLDCSYLLCGMWDDVMWDLSRYHSKCTQRAMRGGTLSGEDWSKSGTGDYLWGEGSQGVGHLLLLLLLLLDDLVARMMADHDGQGAMDHGSAGCWMDAGCKEWSALVSASISFGDEHQNLSHSWSMGHLGMNWYAPLVRSCSTIHSWTSCSS